MVRNSILMTVAAALWLANACASLPTDYPPPPHSVTLEPDPTTSLGCHAADFARRHNADVSGYSAVDANSDGLRWRLALVDSAEQSLDILYYLWYDDLGGLPLLEAGVELYEFRAHPEIQVGIVDTAPVEAGFAGLHTKAAVIDREIVYVGSLNLDPRSIQLNTEMGMVVTSPGLAKEVAAIAERDMAPSNSWRVQLDENGELFWESAEGIVKKQPAQNSWQRIQMWFFGIAPEGQL